jgi:hypothetical protein
VKSRVPKRARRDERRRIRDLSLKDATSFKLRAGVICLTSRAALPLCLVQVSGVSQ